MSDSCRQQTKVLKPTVLEIPTKMCDDPAVRKIDTPQFKSIFTEELNILVDLFKKYNYELRIVGGAVRDILIKIKPKDVDLATTATPKQMRKMFRSEKVPMVNTRGERYGTITPRINNKENFEVTTLRRDVRTDGRFAKVQFGTDWQLDANRRDLTINSMYLGFDGTLYDYFHGYEDLKERRVLFVGDAAVRIQEDYLRILRYFRFYGRIAQKDHKHDKRTLEAIHNNAKGLARINGQRIWSEMQKILVGRFAEDLILVMIECGLGLYCGLPEQVNVKEFKRLIQTLKNFKKTHLAILIMTSLLNSVEDVMKMHERLKLSAYERDLALFITQQRDKVDVEYKNLDDYQILCFQPFSKQEFVVHLLKYMNKKDLCNSIKAWSIPKFPVNRNLLTEKGCFLAVKKKDQILKHLKLIWAESNFNLTTDELLDKHLLKIIERIST